jgi:hypothetical protein
LRNFFIKEPRMGIELKPVRSAERKRVLIKARIISAEGSLQAWVRDLTDSGARISLDRKLHVDSDIIFERAPLFVAGRVAWSNCEEAGIEFYRELPLAALNSIFHPVFID